MSKLGEYINSEQGVKKLIDVCGSMSISEYNSGLLSSFAKGEEIDLDDVFFELIAMANKFNQDSNEDLNLLSGEVRKLANKVFSRTCTDLELSFSHP